LYGEKSGPMRRRFARRFAGSAGRSGASRPAGARLHQRDADRGQGDRDEEPHDPACVEDVREQPAEQARRDPDQRRLQEADLLPPGEHEPPEPADDQAG
jgi:hypothetical protein